MHSFDWKGESETYKPGDPDEINVTFHHNGDYSGEVKINVPTWYSQPSVHNFSDGGEDHHIAELSVPYAALESLVLSKLCNEMISAFEQMSDTDFRNHLKAVLSLGGLIKAPK